MRCCLLILRGQYRSNKTGKTTNRVMICIMQNISIFLLKVRKEDDCYASSVNRKTEYEAEKLLLTLKLPAYIMINRLAIKLKRRSVINQYLL